MTKNEQKELLIKISNDLCGVFDNIACEFKDESEDLEVIRDIEHNISVLLASFDDDNEEPNNYYDYEIPNDFGENEQYRRTNTDGDAMMRTVCKTICFSDCTDEHVIKIVYHGKEIHYTGWQPGMVLEFANDEGEIVWSGCFPEYDH